MAIVPFSRQGVKWNFFEKFNAGSGDLKIIRIAKIVYIVIMVNRDKYIFIRFRTMIIFYTSTAHCFYVSIFQQPNMSIIQQT
jgi:hypothetical protein